MRSREQRVRGNLERLNADLVALEFECRSAVQRTDDALALSDFKRLSPIFDAIVSFVAVLQGQATFLDDNRRQEVELHLGMLLAQLATLQLSTVEPLLRTVAVGSSPLPLGTRYVMDRWRANLASIRDLYSERQERNDLSAVLQRLDSLARVIGERSPDLPDFSSPRQQQRRLDPPPSPRGPGQSIGVQAQFQGTRDVQPSSLRLSVTVRDGKAFLDARVSSALLAELRRHSVQTELAAAFGLPNSGLLMVLNGRDPFAPDRIERVVSVIRDIVGEDRVIFSQS